MVYDRNIIFLCAGLPYLNAINILLKILGLPKIADISNSSVIFPFIYIFYDAILSHFYVRRATVWCFLQNICKTNKSAFFKLINLF